MNHFVNHINHIERSMTQGFRPLRWEQYWALLQRENNFKK